MKPEAVFPNQGKNRSPTANARRGSVEIDRGLCKGCGFCIEFCPRKALAFDEGFNAKGYHPPVLAHPEACVGCNLCGLYCPDFAIYGHSVDVGAGDEGNSGSSQCPDGSSGVPENGGADK